ncbi:MAG: ribosome silencing factor [Spirochaetales bacterium]|nr:ribosome silencing factor [Spirochaetales bacterium]
MDDTLNSKKGYTYWGKVLEAVQDAKAQNPVVLDLEGHCSWTDYMIIVTATSRAHLRGVQQKVLEMLKENDDLVLRNNRNRKDEDQWILMDLGDLVIQIMTADAREYYDLESVWFEADSLYREEPEDHSSSSS